MRFSGHDYHRQYHQYQYQHQHQHQQHAYGQSRIQDHVQPSQPFYSYNQPYEQQFPYISSQSCFNSYNLPHRVPIPSELAHTARPGYTYMQNRQTSFHLGLVKNQRDSILGRGFAVADSMNPSALGPAAAVAAPSLLTQRATNSSIGRSLYTGVGGRGGISFRGPHRGPFNHSDPCLQHRRGRGQGDGGRQIPPHSSRPTNSHVASAPAIAGATSVVQSAPATAGATSLVQSAPTTTGATSVVQSAPATAGVTSMVQSAPATIGAIPVVQSAPLVPGQKPLPTLARVPAAALQPPRQNGGCEICNVQCSGPNLEKHMNGKRHKKKLHAQDELKRLKAAGGKQSEQIPTSQSNSVVHPEKIQELKQEGCQAENILTVDHRKGEIELQKDTGNNTKEPEGEPRDNSVAWDPHSKLNIGDRVGKYMKSVDGSRRPVDFPRPAQAPFICELYSVTCDQIPTSESNSAVHPEKIQELKQEGRQAENITTVDHQKGEIELQKDTGNDTEVPVEEPKGEPRDNSVAWNPHSKHKIGDRVGKYMKSVDGSRRPVEFPQPAQAPFICELCNVTCNQIPTQLNSVVHPEKIQELKQEGRQVENITAVDHQKGEIELQKDTGNNNEVPVEEPEGEPRDNSVAWDPHSKLRIGDRVGKYMKSVDGSRRPVEFPQPVQAPFICELCNVTCDQIPAARSNSAVHPEKIQELKQEGCQAENSTTVDHQKGEIELQKDTGNNTEVPVEEPEGEPRDNSVAWDPHSKLKIGDRVGKYMKSVDGSRRPVESPQPAQAPFICELCNVTCRSKMNFAAHLIGKRHKSNLKREHVPDHQALHRGRGLQALYPPDTDALANLIDSLVERGIRDPQILAVQLIIKSALSQTQEPRISLPSGSLATETQVSTSVAGSGSEPVSTCLADTCFRGHGTGKE